LRFDGRLERFSRAEMDDASLPVVALVPYFHYNAEGFFPAAVGLRLDALQASNPVTL
jgi:hypothetical protein